MLCRMYRHFGDSGTCGAVSVCVAPGLPFAQSNTTAIIYGLVRSMDRGDGVLECGEHASAVMLCSGTWPDEVKD